MRVRCFIMSLRWSFVDPWFSLEQLRIYVRSGWAGNSIDWWFPWEQILGILSTDVLLLIECLLLNPERGDFRAFYSFNRIFLFTPLLCMITSRFVVWNSNHAMDKHHDSTLSSNTGNHVGILGASSCSKSYYYISALTKKSLHSLCLNRSMRSSF